MKYAAPASVLGIILLGWMVPLTLTPGQFALRARLIDAGLVLPPAVCQPTANNAGSLQSCLNNAARGDTISIPLGTYSTATGFTLPAKSGSFTGNNYIRVQSINASSLTQRRQSPADVANMPKLEVTGSGVSLITAAGASGWYFDGLHLTNNIPNPTTGAHITNAIVDIPSGSSDFYFTRCVIHPRETPTAANGYMTTGKAAFNYNGDNLTVENSYIYNFFGRDPTDSALGGYVASEAVTGISNTNPAVVTYDGSPAVNTGDVVQVVFAGGGLDGYFRGGSSLTGDHIATRIDATHFSLPINLVGADVWSSVNSRTAFYKWPRINSITLGNPTTITTVDSHGLTATNKIRPHGLTGTLGTALNNNDYLVTVTSPSSFTIAVSTTGLSAYAGSGGYFKAEGSGQQTVAFQVGADASDLMIRNNYVDSWYSIVQTAGSDATATLTTTLKAGATHTPASIFVDSTTGISVGQMIAVDTTHFADGAKCPTSYGGAYPCFAFGKVSAVNASTGQVDFNPALKIKNQSGVLVAPTAAIIGPVNVNGKNPTNIDMFYNTLESPYDFGTFHYVSNGNTPKGLIEGKDCTDCNFEGNIIQGFPASFALTVANQNGSSPWMGNFNIIIQNNWWKSYRVGTLVTFTDYNARNTQGNGLTVHNNLFSGSVGYEGDCITVQAPTSNVSITHNTCKGGYPASQTNRFAGFTTGDGSDLYYPVSTVPGVIYRDNLVDAGNNVAQCYVGGIGQQLFAPCFNNSVLTHNGFAITFPGSAPLSKFPHASNKSVANWAAVKFVGTNEELLTDWALRTDSPFYHQASDGTDMGVNIPALIAALAKNDGYTGPAPSPTPTPTPVPTPMPTPTLGPTPTPTPTPPVYVVKKVDWPKNEDEQDKIIATQWALGYRFRRNLPGNFAEFEKVEK